MKIEIDPKSGFCFGVVRAISEAERALKASTSKVYSLGDIVHNRIEVQRLEELGLQSISHKEMGVATNQQLLIRAHGEPPTTYETARQRSISVVDATCPVVAKLQQRVIMAHDKMQQVGGSVVLLGKHGHAEVVGLTGQVGDEVQVIENEDDMSTIDFTRPIYFLSQTTQSISLFERLASLMRERAVDAEQVEVSDTICRQVSSREEHLREFVKRFDVILFVCGRKSSNGRVLYEVCCEESDNCYNIESEEELCKEWFEGKESVGICGATSTPAWLMERVAEAVKEM